MVDAGILGEDDRVELLDGLVVAREPVSPYHAAGTNRLTQLLSRLVGESAIVSVQNPVRIDEYNHLQPDLTLLLPRDDYYRESHPGPQDVLLLVEVAVTSLDVDRDVKAQLYARVGIQEFWIVNLVDRLLEVYREPSRRGYMHVTRLSTGSLISLRAFPEVEFTVDEVIGSRR